MFGINGYTSEADNGMNVKRWCLVPPNRYFTSKLKLRIGFLLLEATVQLLFCTCFLLRQELKEC